MATTIHNVKGRDLPPGWRKRAKAGPDELLRITIELESEAGDGLMPPEEDFRPEFIAEVEQRGKEYREGKAKVYTAKNSKEASALLKKIIHFSNLCPTTFESAFISCRSITQTQKQFSYIVVPEKS